MLTTLEEENTARDFEAITNFSSVIGVIKNAVERCFGLWKQKCRYYMKLSKAKITVVDSLAVLCKYS